MTPREIVAFMKLSLATEFFIKLLERGGDFVYNLIHHKNKK